jgi:transposase-like protein
MDTRLEFVRLATAGGVSVAELCRRFGISRETSFQYLRRYREEGVAGLQDRSRRPHTSPRRTPDRTPANRSAPQLERKPPVTLRKVEAASGMIVAQTLTNQDADDPSQVAPLFDQIDGRIGGVTADGAYDGAPTYETIAAHSDGIEVVIPPRSTAIPYGEVGSPTQRDGHLEMITERGRLA